MLHQCCSYRAGSGCRNLTFCFHASTLRGGRWSKIGTEFHYPALPYGDMLITALTGLYVNLLHFCFRLFRASYTAQRHSGLQAEICGLQTTAIADIYRHIHNTRVYSGFRKASGGTTVIVQTNKLYRTYAWLCRSQTSLSSGESPGFKPGL